MRERLRRRQLSMFVGIITIIALLICIIIIAAALYVLADALNAAFIEYFQYALFIIIGILIIQKWITEYEYSIVDGELFVDRYLGKNPKRLFEIKLSRITYIGKTLPESYNGKKQRLTYKSKRSGVVYIIYKSGEDKKCAYFSPSDRMIELLRTRTSKKA